MIRVFRSPRIVQYFFNRRIWRLNGKNTVYITFDDGPTETTRWVLDFLDEQKIKATFFCVGDNALKHPSIFDRIIEGGHSVGNHTIKHEHSSKVTSQAYLQSISDGEKTLSSTLFRPPYGRLSMGMEKKLKPSIKVIMWSWLSYDYDNKVSVDKIIAKAKTQIKEGDILLFHDNEKAVYRIKEILPPIIEDLKRRNFVFKTISA